MANSDGAADLQRWRPPPIYQMLSGGTVVPGQHLNKVWSGLAQVPGSTEPGTSLIIKWVPKKEVLATELACSLAAQALRLQVPPGVLVLAERDQLPGLPARVVGGSRDAVLCFGSELQWPDNTAGRPVGGEAVEEWVWRRLCQTAEGPVGAVWDELVANEDRHHQNVVFDGHQWWLIDHEYSLSPVAKVMKRFAEQTTRQAVIDYQSKTNLLAFEVLTRRSDHKMEQIPDKWGNLKQRLNWMAAQARQWTTGVSEIDTVLMMTHIYLSSIELRLPALRLHLDRRLQNPEKSLLWNSSSTASTAPKLSTKRRPV